jgi:hypothetical protein
LQNGKINRSQPRKQNTTNNSVKIKKKKGNKRSQSSKHETTHRGKINAAHIRMRFCRERTMQLLPKHGFAENKVETTYCTTHRGKGVNQQIHIYDFSRGNGYAAIHKKNCSGKVNMANVEAQFCRGKDSTAVT